MENNVRPGPPKSKRAAWTATQLENAVLAVQRKILSQREAATTSQCIHTQGADDESC